MPVRPPSLSPHVLLGGAAGAKSQPNSASRCGASGATEPLSRPGSPRARAPPHPRAPGASPLCKGFAHPPPTSKDRLPGAPREPFPPKQMPPRTVSDACAPVIHLPLHRPCAHGSAPGTALQAAARQPASPLSLQLPEGPHLLSLSHLHTHTKKKSCFHEGTRREGSEAPARARAQPPGCGRHRGDSRLANPSLETP